MEEVLWIWCHNLQDSVGKGDSHQPKGMMYPYIYIYISIKIVRIPYQRWDDYFPLKKNDSDDGWFSSCFETMQLCPSQPQQVCLRSSKPDGTVKVWHPDSHCFGATQASTFSGYHRGTCTISSSFPRARALWPLDNTLAATTCFLGWGKPVSLEVSDMDHNMPLPLGDTQRPSKVFLQYGVIQLP